MTENLEKTIDLVRMAKNGDFQAMNKLFTRYQDRIYRIARIRLGSELRAKLETVDIGQEVMIKAMNSLRDFEMKSDGDFIHWISKLIENTIRDKSDYFHAEKRSVREEIPLENVRKSTESITQGFTFPGKDPTPSNILRNEEETSCLEEAMLKLDNEDREIILFCDYEELSYVQAGKKLGKSPDAIRMAHKRALAKLTSLLEQK